MQLSMLCLRSYLLLGLIISSKNVVIAQAITSGKPFSYPDLQRLTFLNDVKISPDARAIVYGTHQIDIKHDGSEQTFWIVRLNDKEALMALPRVDEPSWSPDGKSLAVVSYSSNKSTVQLLSADTLKVLESFEVPNRPGSLTWSPDGKQLAFALVTPEATSPSFLERAVNQAENQLERPQNAEWPAPVQITQAAHYREDGRGWLKPEAGHHHIFVLSVKDGILREIGREQFNDDEPAWSADSQFLFFASDRRPGWEHLYPVTSIYRTDMAGHVTRLTQGSDFFSQPTPSWDGKWVAYIRILDRQANYTQSKLYIMHPDGKQAHQIAVNLDRDISSMSWAADSQSVYAKYTDHGIGHVGLFGVDGQNKVFASGLNGNFSVSRDGTIAYSGGRADSPNELMLVAGDKSPETLTSLNPFLQQRQLGKLLHLVANSSGSSVPIEGWALLPPGSIGKEKLPTILVLHGGPFGDDGPTWDSERELFAAAGYVVVYGNYRGSTSYGAAFSEPANTAFPGVAYDSVMSLVDEGIRRGFVDPDRLFVSGSSAGAELTTWITGKTHRFQAAAAEKPPIDQMSEALTSDQYLADFLIYGGAPWLHEKELWANSPLSLAGSVTTPTLFIVGEEDFRTPVEQALEMYDALQLRGIPTALLRAPGASHGSLRSKPSQQTDVIAATLAWFQKFDDQRAARRSGPVSTP